MGPQGRLSPRAVDSSDAIGSSPAGDGQESSEISGRLHRARRAHCGCRAALCPQELSGHGFRNVARDPLAEALLTEDKPHPIVPLIAEREKALGDVQARLAAFSAAPGAVDLETGRLEKEARRRLVQLRALFDRNPHEARVALEALLDGALSFQPIETPDGKRYEITGKIALGSLFTIEGVPSGSRTRVSDVKSRGPGPLDDGDLKPAG